MRQAKSANKLTNENNSIIRIFQGYNWSAFSKGDCRNTYKIARKETKKAVTVTRIGDLIKRSWVL